MMALVTHFVTQIFMRIFKNMILNVEHIYIWISMARKKMKKQCPVKTFHKNMKEAGNSAGLLYLDLNFSL